MPLVTIDEINVQLPEDKLQVSNANDDALNTSVERIVKGKLSGTFSPVTLASWSTPGTTPALVREIIAKLIAAHVYARAFSSEVTGTPTWSQKLYDEAMGLIDGIVLGSITLPEVVETVDTGSRLTRDFFWPNDTTGGTKFRRSDVF